MTPVRDLITRRNRIAEVLFAVHLWQRRHLDWEGVVRLAALSVETADNLLALVEREMPEPELLRIISQSV